MVGQGISGRGHGFTGQGVTGQSVTGQGIMGQDIHGQDRQNVMTHGLNTQALSGNSLYGMQRHNVSFPNPWIGNQQTQRNTAQSQAIPAYLQGQAPNYQTPGHGSYICCFNILFFCFCFFDYIFKFRICDFAENIIFFISFYILEFVQRTYFGFILKKKFFLSLFFVFCCLYVRQFDM